MQEEQIKKFIDNYINGNCSEDEHLQFIELLKNVSNERLKNFADEYFRAMKNKTSLKNTFLASKIEASLDELDLKYENDSTQGKLRHFITFRNAAAAAAVLLFGIISIWVYEKKKEKIAPVALSKNETKQDALPGSNKAILTLANGTAIILDSTTNDTIAQQGGKILKQNGRLLYSVSNQNSQKELYNTVATPAGGQYELVLSDGTKVWLNSSSSLRYPISFFGSNRKVELTGEAYFEVAKNTSMPFDVNVAGQGEVEVLGTHFNINAYDDEAAINTTLFEGKVRFKTNINAGLGNQNTKDINPGEQAQLNKSGVISLYKDVDMDAVLAWKNGYFSFAKSDIHTIMRQLCRWYDMEVVYEGKIPDRRFGGEISRNNNLSQVLKVLEESKIHFIIKGRKIIVGS